MEYGCKCFELIQIATNGNGTQIRCSSSTSLLIHVELLTKQFEIEKKNRVICKLFRTTHVIRVCVWSNFTHVKLTNDTVNDAKTKNWLQFLENFVVSIISRHKFCDKFSFASLNSVESRMDRHASTAPIQIIHLDFSFLNCICVPRYVGIVKKSTWHPLIHSKMFFNSISSQFDVLQR